MKKRLLALLLALAMGLSLAACSAPAAENSEEPSASPSASTEPAIEADLTQDIMTFAAGELANGDPILTVNGEAVSNSLFLYWLAYSCSYFESMYYYYGLTVADYASSILADACSMATYYAILDQKVTEHGCPLTDDQLEAIHTEMEVGGETHEQRKTINGLTEDDVMFIYALSDHFENLTGALVPDPTEADLQAYVDEVGYYQSKHILICTATAVTDGVATLTTGETVEFTGTLEEFNADVQARAQAILDQINADADPIAKFDELMHEHSQDGRDTEGNLAAPDGYVSSPGQMVAEYEEAALALEAGQISGLVQSDYGYHIILRGELEDLDSYAEEYLSAKMDELMTGWMEEAEVEQNEALESLDVADFYERFITWQQAYAETVDTTEE